MKVNPDVVSVYTS